MDLASSITCVGAAIIKAYKNVWIKVQSECKQERPSFISYL